MTDASAQDTATDIDIDALKKLSFTVWSYKMGEVVSALIHIGDRLGLYRAMAGRGPVTAADIAARTDTHERFVTEWLNGMAAARIIARTDDGGTATYELSPEGALILADEEGAVQFSAGAFRGGFAPDTLDAIVESFRTGIGITYEQQGPSAAAGLARMTGPWTRHALVPTLLPRLDGVIEKLESGAKVVDIGCGGGVTTCTLAAAYPNSQVIGIDPSSIAIEQAKELAASQGLDNVEFTAAFGEDLEPNADCDLILTFDCLHDMPHPDVTMAAIRQAIKPDGSWVIKDIRSSGEWERDRRNPLLAMFYGFSVTSCLQSAMSEPDGMGLGTLGLHEAKAREMAEAAGFSSFTVHDIEEPANQYYEVRV